MCERARSAAFALSARTYPRTVRGNRDPRVPEVAPGRGVPFISRLRRTQPHLQGLGYAVALLGIGLMTAGLLPFRDDLNPLTKGFAYLAVVVAAAAIGGLGPGILASVLG